jgi:acyl-CoA thioester hydrolase
VSIACISPYESPARPTVSNDVDAPSPHTRQPVTVRRMAHTLLSSAPYSGHFDAHRHLFAVRVYFEDTDFSGLVYHARYLHFMERARSDMLACAGIDQRAAFEGNEGVYAVADLAIQYRAPAHFDDALLVVSTVETLRGASVIIHQQVMREQQILTQAQVTAAFISREGRPRRQPKPWIEAFTAIMAKEA